MPASWAGQLRIFLQVFVRLNHNPFLVVLCSVPDGSSIIMFLFRKKARETSAKITLIIAVIISNSNWIAVTIVF